MSQTSDPYFCIVALPDQPVADVCVLTAADDASAVARTGEIARAWPGWVRIEVYQGERRVVRLETNDAVPASLPRAA